MAAHHVQLFLVYCQHLLLFFMNECTPAKLECYQRHVYHIQYDMTHAS